MKNINITINDQKIKVPEGTTILEAARLNGIEIPTLCAYEGMGPHAACRLCMVEVKGEAKEKLACAVKVAAGMEITTDSPALFDKRREALLDMFRQHTVDCHHCSRMGGTRIEDLDPWFCENCFFCDCVRDGFCELQDLARQFGISELPFEPKIADFPVDDSTGVLVRNGNKCVKCRRCVDACKNSQAVGILGMVKTENGQTVGVTGGKLLKDSGCIRCGRCVDVCPTGGVILMEHKDQLPYYAHERNVKTAALVDESVLEEVTALYGAASGSVSLGQLAAALKKIGVDEVYDAEEERRITAAETAKVLAKRRKKSPAIIAADPAAKQWLKENHSELEGDFVFMESAQVRFAAETKGRFDKVFRISGRNSLAAEVQDTGCADYFYNARELFRILKRTGADPTRLTAIPLESLGGGTAATEYEPVLGSVDWVPGGAPEIVDLKVKGKAARAVICRNPSQVKEALKVKDAAFIRVNA